LLTPGALGDRLQDTRGAIRQAHRHLAQRVLLDPGAVRAGGARERCWEEWDDAVLFTSRDRRSGIGQHEHSHQFSKQICQRLTLRACRAGVYDREYGADETLRGQRRTRAPVLTVTTLVQRAGQTREDLLPPRQYPRTSLQRLRDTHTREHGLTIQETENRPQARADTLAPGELGQACLDKLALDALNNLVQHREQAIFAVLEQVIKSAP
jgi:hypothetical protein